MRNNIELDDDYTILLDGVAIGFMEINGADDHIINHIEIRPDYRRNGYGKQATALFVKDAQHRNIDTIRTTTVVNSRYEQILIDLGFERTESTHNQYIKHINTPE